MIIQAEKIMKNTIAIYVTKGKQINNRSKSHTKIKRKKNSSNNSIITLIFFQVQEISILEEAYGRTFSAETNKMQLL